MREQPLFRHRCRRTRRRGALLEPVIHIARADHHNDRIEVAILREHALENEIQIRRPDSRMADVAHMNSPSAEGLQALRCIEQLLENAGPARGLVQSEALDGAPANRQHAIKSLLPAGHVPAALPVRVDVESHAPRELGKGLGVRANLDPRPRWPDVITGSSANPPAARRFGDQEESCCRERDAEDPKHHARLCARSRGSRARRSTYGSLRYTKNTDVSPNTTTIATPAAAKPPKFRTSRPSLNHNTNPSTGSADRSNCGPTHHAMKRGPRTTRNRPALIVIESAIFDHFRKISRNSGIFPCVCSRVAVGITTAAMATTNSIR